MQSLKCWKNINYDYNLKDKYKYVYVLLICGNNIFDIFSLLPLKNNNKYLTPLNLGVSHLVTWFLLHMG